jgi:hypothetical protein
VALALALTIPLPPMPWRAAAAVAASTLVPTAWEYTTWETPADFRAEPPKPNATLALDNLAVDPAGAGLLLASYDEPVNAAGGERALVRGAASLGSLGLLGRPGLREHLLHWTADGDVRWVSIDPATGRQSAVATVTDGASQGKAVSSAAAYLPGAKRTVVAWSDARQHAPGIYARLLGADGAKSGREMVVANTPPPARSDVALAAGGKPEGFLAVWKEVGRGGQALVARAYLADGSPRGPARALDGVRSPTAPVVAWSPKGGEYLVFWTEILPAGIGIRRQALSAEGAPKGSAVVLHDVPHAEYVSDAVVHPGTGRILLLWDDYRENDTEIYAQVLEPDGTPAGDDIRVTAVGRNQLHARGAALDRPDSWLVAWQDGRVGRNYEDWNVMARFVRGDGSLGPETPVATEAGQQGEPALAFDAAAGATVVWTHAVEKNLSDIGAKSVRRGFVPSGRARIVVDGGVERPIWALAKWEGATPLGTAIMLRQRSAREASGLAGAPWGGYSRETGKPLEESTQRWIEIEFRLESADPTVSPRLRSFFLQHAKPAPPAQGAPR